jgi:hypothetical protein
LILLRYGVVAIVVFDEGAVVGLRIIVLQSVVLGFCFILYIRTFAMVPILVSLRP